MKLRSGDVHGNVHNMFCAALHYDALSLRVLYMAHFFALRCGAMHCVPFRALHSFGLLRIAFAEFFVFGTLY